MNQILQHFEAGAQNLHAPAELVDHRALDVGPLLLGHQHHRTVKGGKHPAAVNIPGQQHRRTGHFGHAHIDDILCLEVDLRRASRPLDDQDIVFLRQGAVCLHNRGDEPGLVAEIFRRRHVAQHLAVDNDLRALVTGGLEQDRVHPHIRFPVGSLRLHHLSPAHFKAVAGDKGIEGHVLGFEGGYPVAVLGKYPAQPGSQPAFPRVGHGALYHNGFCHIRILPVSGIQRQGRLERGQQPLVLPARAHRHPVILLCQPAVIAAAADQDAAALGAAVQVS